MGIELRARIRFDLLLAIYTTLSPSIIETEIFGMGEYVALDAVVYYNTITSEVWSFEWTKSFTFGGSPDSMQWLFPYSAPILTNIVWAIGILATAAVLMVLKEKLSRRIGLVLLTVATLLPFVIPGILCYSMGSFHTYRRIPLPIPQLVGFLILAVTRNRK